MVIIHDFVDGVTLHPQYVPILTLEQKISVRLIYEDENLLFDFFITTFFEGIEDAVFKASLKLDGGARQKEEVYDFCNLRKNSNLLMMWVVLLFDVLAEVFRHFQIIL